ncbi:hypothetical protein C5167_016081 [Papaver somniferum]|uniref:interferon-induced, double-stranded RNA-activated protein kinase-like n=1 Tax=Papaver somniferum TaxID=3469 RepID=UPI000E6FBF71|nr:interferon-induced, double-stranded RNA-activated protein kinase-like [Papaver somniferum]XP_026435432.1 interferon-induced, double-stranded RNA-activated protein kinase-like [Papaver somniferum]XP_026435433.1 interferon-induced, double-stranded RNA-activated protein kinase-like [Papaver somniferum]XP_026435434.1 interferon-induced, double-stranded RNA-activated protein kinase-like [Papaver somniferum]RZC88289.1 hypothetical protein C5167_016081 [Papaver somniferum]
MNFSEKRKQIVEGEESYSKKQKGWYSVQSRVEQDFKAPEALGEGFYGEVQRGSHVLDGCNYAIKRIRFVGLIDQLLPEVHALPRLNNEGIVRYFSSWEEFDEVDDMDVIKIVKYPKKKKDGEEEDSPEADERDVLYFDSRGEEQQEIVHKSLYIQMEMCERPLYDAIMDGIGCEEGLEYFRQISSVVAYMHSKNVAHRDLSSQNIFSCESSKIKIGDFGIAHIIGEKDLHSESPGNELYSAPERSEGEVEDVTKVDMYSMGILLLELVSNIKSAMGRIKVIQNFKKGEEVSLSTDFKEEALVKELIKLLTSSNPSERPTAEDLCLRLA